MKIKQINIQNYRVHRDTEIDFDSLTAFIGRNGSGKSSVLYALDFFYDVSRALTGDDVYAGEDEEVTVTVTYSNLSVDELDEFALYVRDGQLVVIKRAQAGQHGRYYGIVPQLPEFVDVRNVSGATNQRAAYNEVRESGRFQGLPTVRNQAEVVGAMDAFERDPANSDLLQLFEREEQFFGDRRAGAGRLDKYTAFVLVPAVRDATGESGKRGAIQVLVDRLVSHALARRADILQFRTEFEERFRETYAPENLTEINRVSESVNELLGRYAPGLGLRLEWGEAVPPEFGLPSFNARLGDHIYDTPIAYQGHGMQRALVLSLLQLMTNQHDEVNDGEGDEAHTSDLIVAIEEPELYLHPSQCRYLSRLLCQLAADPGPPIMQVIYATHSQYFVSMDGFERIRAVRRCAHVEGAVPSCEIGSLSFDRLRGEIARVAELDPEVITRDSFVARCATVMDIISNEGFFASAIIVVEGYGDLGCLRVIEQRLGLNWDERGVVIVPARSKNNIEKPVQIFSGIGIPCYFLFDGDVSKRGRNGEADAISANHRLMRLANAAPEDFPETQVQNTWAVLDDCLETEVKSAFADAGNWDAVVAEIRQDMGFASVKQMLKNPDGMAAVVRSAYDNGRGLPVLEDVARHVTDLL